MVIGAFPEEATLDIISEEWNIENPNPDHVRVVLDNLSIALMALCRNEIETNKVGKTQPLYNLCRFLVSQFPEVVLDDETYYLRKTLIDTQEAIRQNPNARLIRDAFMEFDLPEHDKTFQLQVVAVSSPDDYMPQDKVQIFTQDDED